MRTGSPMHLPLSGISTRREGCKRTRIVAQVEGVLVQVEGEQVLIKGAITEGAHEGQIQDLPPGFTTRSPERGSPGACGLDDGFTGGDRAGR